MLFIMVLIYAGLIYVRPSEIVTSLRGMHLVEYVGAVAIGCWLLSLTSSKRNLVKTPENLMILGLLGSVGLSHLFQPNPYIYGAISSVQEFAKRVIIYFLIVNTVSISAKRGKIFIWTLILLTLFLAYEGIKQYYTGMADGGISPIIKLKRDLINDRIITVKRIRWSGIFNDPNDLSLALVVAVPLLLHYIVTKGKSLLIRASSLAILLPIGYAIYLCNSRGGYLALIAAVSAFFVLRSQNKIRDMTLAAVVGIILFTAGPSRLSMLSAKEASAYNRIDAWYHGIEMLKGNPLFGGGMGMFIEDSSLTAHNSFVLAFAELGLIGAFFWVGMFYFCFKELWRLNRGSVIPTEIGFLSSAVQASLIGFLTAAFFLSRTYNWVLYLLISSVTAFTEIGRRELDSPPVAFNREDLRNIAIIEVVGILLIYTTTKVFL